MRLPFLRSKSDAGSADRTASFGDEPGTLQAARTQARRRLIGAVVLLVVAVAGFPLLFETQPRPMPGKGSGDGTAVVIRGEAVVRGQGAEGAAARPEAVRPSPAALPATAPATTPAATASSADRAAAGAGGPVASGAPAVAAAAAAVAPAVLASSPAAKPVVAKKPDVAASAPTKATAASQPAAKSAVAAAATQPEKAENFAKPDKAAPASAAASAASGASAAPADAAARWVVQVGAYNDMERMRLARQKAEKLGFKTYTTEVDTPTGKRTRVRLGPFATKGEAEAAAVKVKANGMAANVLSL